MAIASRYRRAQVDPFSRRLESICAQDRVLTQPDVLRTYESDGLLQYRAVPRVAVLPDSGEEVRAVVVACHDAGVPWVARGSGTGLSGGALPREDGVLIVLSRLRRILEVDLPNQRVTVEPGVTNREVSAIVAAGIVPGALEIMDRVTLAATEEATGAGLRTDVGAALIVEVDGPEAECDAVFDRVVEICRRAGALDIRVAADDAEREL